MMCISKLSILGIFVVLGFVLIAVGLFTPAWVCGGWWFYSCGGIVPFYSDEDVWIAVASWLMYISFAASIILLFNYYQTQRKVKKIGFCRDTKKWFFNIACLSFFVVLLTTISVATIGIYASVYSDWYNQYRLGWSAWLCVASAVFNLVTFLFSVYIMRHDCC